MQDFLNKKILLGICGGIAAYKTAYLVRELKRAGALVRVVMTQSSQQFITKMTLQALSGEVVRDDLWDEQAERAMGHIELARWADYVLIAPASANFLAKMAHGIADDLLSTLCLVTDTPILVCPAMNHSMWEHSATQSNCACLASRNVIFIGPSVGEQACGEWGDGRMSDVQDILAVLSTYIIPQNLTGRHVLITAGPTRELIDPVRYLSNRSSGKMGYALAKAAMQAGATVTLISGPSELSPPKGVLFNRVESAQQMFDAVMQHLMVGTIFIGAAAVADYTIAQPASNKLKKQMQDIMTLTLVKTKDILASVVQTQKAAYVVGFAAETTQVVEHAYEKLQQKGVDMIIANDVSSNLGFDKDDNQVIVLTKNDRIDLEFSSKTHIAQQIIAILSVNLQNNVF